MDRPRPSSKAPRMWLPTFSRMVREGRAPEDVILCAAVTTELAKVADDGSVELVISSEDVDRDRDVVRQSGLDFASYQKNPVVLWAHDHGRPSIGRSEEIHRDGNRTISRDVFDLDDPFAASVHRKLAGRFLQAASIGGGVLKFEIDEKRKGLDVLDLDVWEHSVCNVPANPQALALAAAADGVPLEDDLVFQWCMETLAAAKGEGLWLTRQTAEALTRGLRLTRGLEVFELAPAEAEAAMEARVAELAAESPADDAEEEPAAAAPAPADEAEAADEGESAGDTAPAADDAGGPATESAEGEAVEASAAADGDGATTDEDEAIEAYIAEVLPQAVSEALRKEIIARTGALPG